MPELPEVETIARQLDEHLSGKIVKYVEALRTDVIHGDPRPLDELLVGKRIDCVRRRGKRIIHELQPAGQLIIHLGMSGRLHLCDIDDPLQKHTHLRIQFRAARCELRFLDPRRFGGVWCLADGRRHVGRKLSDVGLEPLDMTPAVFRRALNRHRQIKALLLDQHEVAGLGNIYCDEVLHAACIHPLTEAGDLDRAAAARLLRAIKSTLRRAIRFGGSTTADYRQADGQTGSFQKHHRVYHREGQPCPKCGTTIDRIRVAGRSTFLCPACQPHP